MENIYFQFYITQVTDKDVEKIVKNTKGLKDIKKFKDIKEKKSNIKGLESFDTLTKEIKKEKIASFSDLPKFL